VRSLVGIAVAAPVPPLLPSEARPPVEEPDRIVDIYDLLAETGEVPLLMAAGASGAG
jgi:hypothetical protein